jgi:CheY-like chemotaxis protein
LLTFGRREIRRPRPLDLRVVVQNMARLLGRLLGAEVALDTRFDEGLPSVYADPGMMEQVLLNLAVNARDAMPDGGQLRITLEPLTLGAAEVAVHPGASPGPHVLLQVHDSGSGIPPDVLPHIFEPFFTTKDSGRGTGLGLATVFGIVQQHEGWIDVTSAPGQGSTFRVVLPGLVGEAGEVSGAAADPEVAGGKECVLLVDDDPGVRRVARAVLERYGYRVAEAASAKEALACWEALAHPVDLLLTDLVMPGGMSGGDLAVALRDRKPGLRVVFCSGYSADVVHRHLKLERGLNFLQKPYTIADLARTVRRALDAA